MNRTIFAGLIALSILPAAITSCSSDKDEPAPSYIPETVRDAFQQKFPDATNVDWDTKSSYYIAEFKHIDGAETEVWYTSEADWAMTVTDYGKDLFLLPANINEAFAKSPYGFGWTIDDIDLYERASDSFYIFEVERSGQPDTNVYFDSDGTYLKAVESDADTDILPTTPLS
ncbi:MAG: PepSY-like domain-containing protein [Muribaculaceae bacterium]|nr:PepSY-like domain-containing protein [Muribaculaceae bacterium]